MRSSVARANEKESPVFRHGENVNIPYIGCLELGDILDSHTASWLLLGLLFILYRRLF